MTAALGAPVQSMELAYEIEASGRRLSASTKRADSRSRVRTRKVGYISGCLGLIFGS